MKSGMDASQSRIYRSKVPTVTGVRKKQGSSEGKVALVLGNKLCFMHYFECLLIGVCCKLCSSICGLYILGTLSGSTCYTA